MRIVLLSPGLAGYRMSLAAALSRAGHDVLLVTDDWTEELGDGPPGVRTQVVFGLVRPGRFSLMRKMGLVRLLNALRVAGGCARAVRVCMRARPDVVHVQGLVYGEPFAILLLLALRGSGRRLVLTPHNSGPRRGGLTRRAAWRVLVGIPDRLVVHSEAARGALVALGATPDRVTVIPHANLEAVKASLPETGRDAARRALGLPDTARVILLFGHLLPYKGLPALLRAMPAVIAEVPAASLLVAGRTPGGLEAARRLIAELGIGDHVVARPGWVPASVAGMCFAAADVVAMPYTAAAGVDQSGVAQLAFSFGLPVVASDVGGLGEEVEDGVTGVLVPPGDVAALARALVALLADPERARRMGRAAKAAAQGRTWEDVAARTVIAYGSPQPLPPVWPAERLDEG